MAFPTIPTTGANTLIPSVQGTATTTHTFGSLTTLDNASGDLLIAVIVLYQASATANAFSSWGGGFTEFGDSASAVNPSMAMGCAYKISDGTETGTFTVTSSISGRSAMFLMSVKNWHGTTVPEVAFSAETATTAQDPPSLNPAGWGAEDTLWIAVAAGGQTSLTGSWGGITSAPASYTDYAESSIAGGDAIGACQIAVAFRGNNVSAENPGSFTTDTSPEIERAATVAVRPVPVPVEIAGNLVVTATSTSTEQVVHPVDGSLALSVGLAGTGQGVYNASADLPVTVGLTGDADVAAGGNQVDVDGTLALSVGLAATGQGDYAAAGNLALSATSTSTEQVVHPVDGTLALTAGLSATASTLAAAAGNCSVTVSLSGTADVVSPGQVSVDGELAVTSLAAGSAALALPVDGDLALSATLTGAASVTLTTVVEVDGALIVTVTFTSEPIVGPGSPHTRATPSHRYVSATPSVGQHTRATPAAVYAASTAQGVL